MKERVGITFQPGASQRVYYYTAGNPFYIWKFCKKLFDYTNGNYNNIITVYDVDQVAEMLISHDELTAVDFDNLILEGESESVSIFSKSETTNILRKIAVESVYTGSCPEQLIRFHNELDNKVSAILNRLVLREVLCTKGVDKYEIIVKLFSMWLYGKKE